MNDTTLSILRLDAIANGSFSKEPFPHLMASDVLHKANASQISKDYPDINKAGFFPIDLVNSHGAFDALMKELQGPEFAAVLSDKLGVELRDKARMITIRRWSASKDGRIHNDGEAKIVTALIYLNDNWPGTEDGGRFRILSSDKSFDDSVAEATPNYGSFAAFVRTENSWHGHKPFVGERRVVQVTWLRSWEDLERKNKRGRLAYFLKKFLPGFKSDY